MITIPGRHKAAILFHRRGYHSKPAEISLYPGTLYIFHVQNQPVNISLRSGKLFITQESDPSDHILNPGETTSLSHKGRVIIEAFTPSVFTRTPSARIERSNTARSGR